MANKRIAKKRAKQQAQKAAEMAKQVIRRNQSAVQKPITDVPKIRFTEAQKKLVRNINARLKRMDAYPDLRSPSVANLRKAIKGAGLGYDFISLPRNPTLSQVLNLNRILNRFEGSATSNVIGARRYRAEKFENFKGFAKAAGYDNLSDARLYQIYEQLGDIDFDDIIAENFTYREIMNSLFKLDAHNFAFTENAVRTVLKDGIEKLIEESWNEPTDTFFGGDLGVRGGKHKTTRNRAGKK